MLRKIKATRRKTWSVNNTKCFKYSNKTYFIKQSNKSVVMFCLSLCHTATVKSAVICRFFQQANHRASYRNSTAEAVLLVQTKYSNTMSSLCHTVSKRSSVIGPYIPMDQSQSFLQKQYSNRLNTELLTETVFKWTNQKAFYRNSMPEAVFIGWEKNMAMLV